jgi:hypothetical protein
MSIGTVNNAFFNFLHIVCYVMSEIKLKMVVHLAFLLDLPVRIVMQTVAARN